MDISQFRDRPTSGPISVSELNNHIKRLIESNRLLASVAVKGEISNLKRHSSGHIYFSLKDSEGQLRAVMFRSAAYGLKFNPENGMRVIAYGSVSVYTRDGTYQLYASSIQPDGIGALYLAYEQLKAKLESEGMFSPEHKRDIPAYPDKIGVITSPTGAAVRDIINVLGRRYPSATVYLYPALVQGVGAEEMLVDAVDYFDKSGLVDTIIIGRGGGSIEDLWAFNSEKLARRIFACEIPVISAVGHETDFTICDFVADMRAPTPSAAAELAVPDVRELTLRVANLFDRLNTALERRVELLRERVISLSRSCVISSPETVLERHKTKVRDCSDALINSFISCLKERRRDISLLVGKLEALSPLAVLSRGYSIVFKDGAIVSGVESLNIGDEVNIRLGNGKINACVTDVNTQC